MRSLLLLPLSLLFIGCVGIGMVVSDKRSGNSIYSLKKVTTFEFKETLDKKDIIALRGEPYKKVVEGNHEDWYYRRELAWGGIIPVIILPIPLLLPYGYRDTTMKFENNIKINEEEEYGRAPIAECSLIPMMWLVHGSTNSWCHVFKSFN